jgi:HD-like signal output (HDOD) protein
MSNMRQDLLTQLSGTVETLPVFRKSAQKVLVLAADTTCKPSDLINTIYKDPILTLKVLKVINSPHYNLNRKVNSVELALVHMGINPIKNLLLPLSKSPEFMEDKNAGFDLHQYLLYLLCTAHIAKRLAQQYECCDPTECFVAGLLHDFGKLALAHALPVEFADALQYSKKHACPLHLALQNSIDTDYAHISAHLLQEWNFSSTLVEAAQRQHQVNDNGMNICVFAAIQITKHLNFGFGGDNCVVPFPDVVKNKLDGTLEQVLASLQDLDSLLHDVKMRVLI